MSNRNLVDALKNVSNKTTTTNGATALKSTLNMVYDMFAFAGAYRGRSDVECITLFKNAYDQDPEYALKCLFYNRDILQGQGERRFFRVCLNWLAQYDKDAVIRNLKFIPILGRWDDLYCLVGTPAEEEAFNLIKNQIYIDLETMAESDTTWISLCAKWLKSENSSSQETKRLAVITRNYLNLSAREYRKMLSAMRERIKVLERLMSQGRWNEIEFDKIPSRAGLLYKNVFARHDLVKERYEKFIKDDTTKVNAKALYPYDVVEKAISLMGSGTWNWGWSSQKTVALDDTERLAINKYWDNLTDYFNGATLNAMVVCDTSGSMLSGGGSTAPINIAVSLAMYTAERAKGPFANHYISFSRDARLVPIEGVDFCDKVDRIVSSNVCENTSLSSVFDLLVNTINAYHLTEEDMPKTLIVCSDMQIDPARDNWSYGGYNSINANFSETSLKKIRQDWMKRTSLPFPEIIYWNVNASNNTILDDNKTGVTYVSGASPVLFQQILEGVSGIELMIRKLDSERYKEIK